MGKGEASTCCTKSQPCPIPTSNDDREDVIITVQEFDNWSNDPTIFRIPKMLRELDEKAYTPQLVSIGPFHYGGESFKGMQLHKENYYLKKFLERTSKSKEVLLNFVRENFEDMIQSKYAGAIKLGRKKFEEIILIDACFIFELFIRNSENEESKDYILRTSLFRFTIRQDLIMLENQIPFCFLKELYDFSKPSNNDEDQRRGTFLQLSMEFFGLHRQNLDENNSIKHFTDLRRWSWLPEDVFKNERYTHLYTHLSDYLNSATKIDRAGVDFAPPPKKYNSTPLTKVQLLHRRWCKFIPFCSSLTLQLPVLSVGDDTEYTMRNIMAMELCQSDPHRLTPICNYICLMDDLINTEEDVELLVSKNVIQNGLGSNKNVADLFNKLCRNMPITTFIYAKEYHQLNQFYDKWYNHTKTTLKRVYFKDIWTGSSTVIGVFVLIFTLISTIDSIFYFKEKKHSFGQ